MSFEEHLAISLIGSSIAGFFYFIYYCEKVFYKIKDDFRFFYIYNNTATLSMHNDFFDISKAIEAANTRDEFPHPDNFIHMPLSSIGSGWSAITPVAEDDEES